MEDKIKEFESKYKELLKEYGLEMSVNVDFPQYKILPLKVQLALQILGEEGVQFRTIYKEVNDHKV